MDLWNKWFGEHTERTEDAEKRSEQKATGLCMYAVVYGERYFRCTGIGQLEKRLEALAAGWPESPPGNVEIYMSEETEGLPAAVVGDQPLPETEKRILVLPAGKLYVLYLNGMCSVGLCHAVCEEKKEMFSPRMQELLFTADGEDLPAAVARALTDGVDAALPEALMALTDEEEVTSVLERIAEVAEPPCAPALVRVVDALADCPCLKEAFGGAEGLDARVAHVLSLPKEEIGTFLNVWVFAQYWYLERQRQAQASRLQELAKEMERLESVLPDRPEPLWAVRERQELEAGLQASADLYESLAQACRWISRECQEDVLAEREQRMMASLEKGNEEGLRELAAAVMEEDATLGFLQKMAGRVADAPCLAEYPATAQYVCGRFLMAADGMLPVSRHLHLDEVRKRIGHPDSLTRLYVLTEERVVDEQARMTARRLEELDERIEQLDSHEKETDGYFVWTDLRELTAEELDKLQERALQLHTLVKQLGHERTDEDWERAYEAVCKVAACADNRDTVELTAKERDGLALYGLSEENPTEDGARSDLTRNIVRAARILAGCAPYLEGKGARFLGWYQWPDHPYAPATVDGIDGWLPVKAAGEEPHLLAVFAQGDTVYYNQYNWLRGMEPDGTLLHREANEVFRQVLEQLAVGETERIERMFTSQDAYRQAAGGRLTEAGLMGTVIRLLEAGDRLRHTVSMYQRELNETEWNACLEMLQDEAAACLEGSGKAPGGPGTENAGQFEDVPLDF